MENKSQTLGVHWTAPRKHYSFSINRQFDCVFYSLPWLTWKKIQSSVSLTHAESVSMERGHHGNPHICDGLNQWWPNICTGMCNTTPFCNAKCSLQPVKQNGSSVIMIVRYQTSFIQYSSCMLKMPSLLSKSIIGTCYDIIQVMIVR